jgi:hypothetical protein
MLRERFVACFTIALAFHVAAVYSAEPYIAENAPADCDGTFSAIDLEAIVKEMAPKALEGWPSAKARYLAGLPERHSLFVTILLTGDSGQLEYLFVAVDGLENDEIRGRVWNEVRQIKDLYHGASIALPEDSISDWLITKPDGTEEGNLIGKYMDTLAECRSKTTEP